MIQRVEIKILPQWIENEDYIRAQAIQKANIAQQLVTATRLVKRSIDARGRQPFYILQIDLYIQEAYSPPPALLSHYRSVAQSSKHAIIIGAGPAGYFAALQLIELGIRPIIFERGKDVRARRRDLRAIQQGGIVNPNSNYCFGEGGAGTYSDGKLYTRSHKRGSIEKVLRLFVEHGAMPDILTDAHPHIGTNKLPNIVANLRQTILAYGGEVHFESLVTDLLVQNGAVRGVVVNHQTEHFAQVVMVATGHSARDVFEWLHRQHIRLEAKPFALGVRIEHPQEIIDRVQYHQSPRDPNLPAASYQLVCQVGERGVFSFCMCPGGLVVPAATAPGEIVVNGMSPSKRDSPFANSGTVVAVELQDLQPFANNGIFAGIAFQASVERAMFAAGDGSQKAPAQRLTDFVKGNLSPTLPPTSYIPGLFSAPVHQLLPHGIYSRLQTAIQVFGSKMKGYFTEEANVIGTESRTSSPIRIPRNPETLMHDDMRGLFPSGEGAGYAGGILSAAMDGQNVANAIARFLTQTNS